MEFTGAFGMSENTLFAIIIVLILVLVGFLTFGFSMYAVGKDGVSFGAGFEGNFGGSGRETYIVIPKDEGLTPGYPHYNIDDAYMNEGFEGSIYDSSAGVMSTPATGRSTIIGYDEVARGRKMPTF